MKKGSMHVTGYGMDYEQTGRHLPEIYIQVEG